MRSTRTSPVFLRSLALLAVAGLTVAGCGGGSNKPAADASATTGVTITVALASQPPPAAALAAFQKETGITVTWSNIDWDSLQTKITAAATANTYFADATDVDWSRVGQLAKLKAFHPMGDYLDTAALVEEMPQLTSFTADGNVVGIPYDASFMVTTVNRSMFAKAGVSATPTTMAAYTAGLTQIKAKGVSQYPLNIPFAAAEGLSTYWYQTTAAFGGTILDESGKPQFGAADSGGRKAAAWMVDAFTKGLVPPGNINVTDSQGQQTLMAKGKVASVFSDYSGTVGSLYNVPASSAVVNQVGYLPTPGASGPGPNLSNPDGIGIPKTARHPEAAARFITWFTSAANQADFAGLNGSGKALSGYTLPSRLSVVEQLTAKGQLIGGDQLGAMLKTSSGPVFKGGAPSWYPEFSRAVNTNLHAAAAGQISADKAVDTIAAVAERLAATS